MQRCSRPRSPRFAVLGALVGLALVACAPAAPPSSTKPGGAAGAPGGQAAGPAAAPVAPDKIVRGGTFIIGMHGDLVNFDAVTQSGALHVSVMGLVQSGLMKGGKSIVVDPTKLTCDLCESWSQPDATTYEFKLRQGVRWHNLPPTNGREF